MAEEKINEPETVESEATETPVAEEKVEKADKKKNKRG